MQDADTSGERMWVLKTTAHRGQGVSVTPQQQAMTAALASSTGEGAPIELVQEYKSQQYTVAGRRFYLRYPESQSWEIVHSRVPVIDVSHTSHPLLQHTCCNQACVGASNGPVAGRDHLANVF